MANIAVVTPPSPPYSAIDRQAAGGMGLWIPVERAAVGHSEYSQYDLNLLSTAGVLLQAGHDVSFCDGQAERLATAPFAELVSKCSPDVILGMVQFVSLQSDLEILGAVKQRCPGAVLIVVGSVARVLRDEILACPTVDYLVVGEPEVATGCLVAALGNGETAPESIPGVASMADGESVAVEPEPITDLASLPPIPYHLLAPYRYVDQFYFRPDKLGLAVTSRGCPFGCRYYCPYPLAYGTKVKYRNPEVVVGELEVLNRELGVSAFHFRDQVFTVSAKHARAVCQGIVDAGLRIRWLCETRFDLIKDDDLLRLMKEAGCVQIHFGLESGDPALLEEIGKPGTTLDLAESAIRRVREQQMSVHVHLIVGLPGETWTTIHNTLRFLRRLDLDHVNLNRCIPYPGTEFYFEAEANNWIESRDWTRYGNEFVCRSTHMSSSALEWALKYLCVNFHPKEYIGRRDRWIIRPVLNALVGRVLK